MRKIFVSLFPVFFALSPVNPVWAVVYSGNLIQDDDVALLSFTVTTSGYYDIHGYAYAGGMLSDGAPVSGGGFDTIITLFNGTGSYVGDNDDGDGVNLDPISESAYDSRLITFLGLDTYTIAVSQYDNFANGPTLSDGFYRQGQGNFTLDLYPDCLVSSFCDGTGSSLYGRTSAWVVEVTPAVVPLPATLPLFLSGIAGLGLLYHRHKLV